MDAPLGEAAERYEIVVLGVLGAFECEATSAAVTILSAELAALGSGPATITIRQIGDWAGSRPAGTVIHLP